MNDFEKDDLMGHGERPIHPHPEPKEKTQIPDDGLPFVAKKTIDYRKKIGICIFVLLFLVILLVTGNDETSKENTPVMKKKARIIPDYTVTKTDETPPSQPITPPKTPSPDDITLQKMRMMLALKQQEMDMKLAEKKAALYQLRLKSPMDLIKENNQATVMVTSDSGQAHLNPEQSRLPLTQSQIMALSKAQGNDPNEAFQKKGENSTVASAKATRIPYLNETITQGTMIFGNLETAINSDLPGQVSAVVSEDIYSSTGTDKLIPKGSKLVGHYNAGILLGQRRVMVMWTQVTRPDGVRVLLGSPGTDNLGTSGLDADVLQTHFWERFGGATLVSIVGGLVATAGVNNDEGYNSSSDYRMMMSQNFQQSANSQLLSGMNRKPTIYKYQGATISVFVNRDLSFHGVNNE